jgi:hypothetical protein
MAITKTQLANRSKHLGSTDIVALTRGKITVVSIDRYCQLVRFKWRADYDKRIDRYDAARSCVCVGDGKRRTVYMARQILSCPVGKLVDHKNHDTLDNTDENIRTCSKSQNSMNSKKMEGTSNYKGVSWNKLFNKWEAQIGYNKKRYHLGLFYTEISAALAYNIAARSYFGEFAYLGEVA